MRTTVRLHRPWIVLFALGSTACFAAAPGVDDESSGDETSSSGSESTAVATSSSSESTTADASTSDATDGTGDPPDGYPPEVLDVLDLPFPPADYDPELPPHFQVDAVRAFDNTPDDNPITDDGAVLGLVLFHDRALSIDESIACASCHRQPDGFSDPAIASTGVAGETDRNSMPAIDARFYDNGRFFWDERAATLEEQVLQPIENEVEMGMTLPALVERLGGRAYYPPLFERAFGDPEITQERISAALAQYVRSVVSYRSRYDEGLAQVDSILDPFPNFTPEENLGKQIFLGPAGACAPCHLGNVGAPPMPGVAPANQAVFFVVGPANNGLDVDTSADPGLMATTGNPADDGRFKSPSLRNVALTAPYMHDGRFETLAEVVEHYASGVQDHPNLDPRLRGPDDMPRTLALDDAQKAALVAFLGTLSDEALATDPRFRDPFRE